MRACESHHVSSKAVGTVHTGSIDWELAGKERVGSQRPVHSHSEDDYYSASAD